MRWVRNIFRESVDEFPEYFDEYIVGEPMPVGKFDVVDLAEAGLVGLYVKEPADDLMIEVKQQEE